MNNDVIGSGRLFAELANSVSDAIAHALTRGMRVDEAACCVVAVAADYARGAYGNEYLANLVHVIVERTTRPLPATSGGDREHS